MTTTCELEHGTPDHPADHSVLWPSGERNIICGASVNAIRHWCPTAIVEELEDARVKVRLLF